jgi:NOL1/NOP2/sun family putative RNA methylase
MANLLVEEYPAFLSSLHLPALAGLRVNSLKISPTDFVGLSPWKLSPVEWCSTGFVVETNPASADQTQPGKHPFHSAGLYYLQEPSAMAAAQILAPQPGEKVLDLAAAPGGKTTHLAALMQNTGLLLANEIHPKRVWDLVENLERCGVTNAVVTNETPQRLADHFGEFFDKVLVDAPCSGEGMFRKAEVARQEWKPDLVRSCALRQAGILEQAARLVQPAGCLAYTTCTFSTEENEALIASFLSHHPEFDLQSIPNKPGLSPARPDWIGLPPDHRLCHAVRIWPHLARGEGHFIALMRKNGRAKAHPGTAAMKIRPHSIERNRVRSAGHPLLPFETFLRENLGRQFEASHLVNINSYIYLLPQFLADLSNLHVIRSGWWLGSVRKDYFVPSYALALGMKHFDARHTLRLQPGDSRLSDYLAGQTILDPGENAWVLLTVGDFPIGWGKRVQDVVKNYYPKGLRKPV